MSKIFSFVAQLLELSISRLIFIRNIPLSLFIFIYYYFAAFTTLFYLCLYFINTLKSKILILFLTSSNPLSHPFLNYSLIVLYFISSGLREGECYRLGNIG